MKEHPILFSGPMVRAILDGRKTQARRIVNPQPKVVHEFYPDGTLETERLFRNGGRIRCPYGVPGDRLWVRETWADVRGMFDADIFPDGVSFKADCDSDSLQIAKDYGVRWKPSIYMPRWASRITLELEDVRGERLHDITEADARAEGTPDKYFLRNGMSTRDAFEALWDEINGARAPWSSNPWVWVLNFRRVEA